MKKSQKKKQVPDMGIKSDIEINANLRFWVDFYLEDAYSKITDELKKRIAFELDYIAKHQFALDFLFAKEVACILEDIDSLRPFCIGATCGSVVAYILGITWYELEPITHGLIFERGFSKHSIRTAYFSFSMSDEIKNKLITTIISRNPNVVIKINELTDFTELSFNGAIISILGEITDCFFCDIIEESGLFVFQEDYMSLLRYTAGYSYEKTDEIRRAVGQNNPERLIEFKCDFFAKCKNRFSTDEAADLFDTIISEIDCAPCKAYVLSANKVSDYLLPF